MTRQSLDTEALDAAVASLRGANNSINAAFTSVERQSGVLEGTWHSRAGSIAVTQLHQLIKANESRSAVLQNYISLLTQTVEQGYMAVEEANTSLAAYFR